MSEPQKKMSEDAASLQKKRQDKNIEPNGTSYGKGSF